MRIGFAWVAVLASSVCPLSVEFIRIEEAVQGMDLQAIGKL
jgi:hypothetical protein